MRIFTSLYKKMLSWAAHKNAKKYLAIISIAESSFFPIPVDVMLAPMVLVSPKNWWRLALLTAIMSVIGAIIGYFIGFYFYDFIKPLLIEIGYQSELTTIKIWFDRWGVWIVLVLGFSPMPYKIATISAGFSGMALAPFILTSFIGRSARFLLVSFLVKLSVKKIQSIELKWIERLGWLSVFLLIIFMGIQWLN